MPDNWVLEGDAVRAKHGARLTRYFDSGPDVAHLAEADLFRSDLACFLEPAQVQSQQLSSLEIREHPRELALGELKAADLLAELLPGSRVLRSGFETGSGRSGNAPDDAEARLGQTREGALQALHAGEHRAGRQFHIVEVEFRSDGGAKRQLLVNIAGGETTGAAGDEETADAVFGVSPDDGNICDRAVRDPHFGAAENPVCPVPFRICLHAGRVAAVIWLSKPEAPSRVARSHAGQPLFLL